jgi:hypothetical protein
VVFEYNPKAPPPCIPPNELGIGSEEDSLQSVFHLAPKAPTQDYLRYKEVQGIVLRYAARMVAAPGLGSLGPYDADRRCALWARPGSQLLQQQRAYCTQLVVLCWALVLSGLAAASRKQQARVLLLCREVDV